MNKLSIIVLVVTLLSVAVSFWVLFKQIRATNNVIVEPSYKNVSILQQKYKNEGDRMTQEELLENTDYVLDAF